jgi:hypothetical protein
MTDNRCQPLQPPLRTRDLSAQQRSLLHLMREHQFGRVENMPVEDGEPILDGVKIVRVVRLGAESNVTHVTRLNDFELKNPVCDLFEKLAQLRNGTIVRLEFRRGLPFLLETTVTTDNLSIRAPQS